MDKIKLSWPGLKILDRYILRKFLGTYLFAIAMITVILVVFDYAERVDNFTESHAPFTAIVFDYYLNYIPEFITQFSGLFTFISVIFFTSKMAYQTEIIAILSGGVSFRRLMWPYFLGAFAIMALSLSLNLWVIPPSQVNCVNFKKAYFKKYKNEQYDRHIYRQIAPGEYVYVRGFDNDNTAEYFTLERYDGTQIRQTLEAEDISVDPETKRWTAQRYITRHIDANGEEEFKQLRDLDTVINLDVTELGRIDQTVKTMKIGELNEFLDQQRKKGSDSINIIEVAKHTRYSYPMATFILTLIGVSLSARKVKGGMGLNLGIGIGLSFGYIVFQTISSTFAVNGNMPPVIAVWIPNIVFLVIGIFLYWKAPK